MAFTGDKIIFLKCMDFLQKEGFAVADAIHIGNNRYEFTEDMWKNGWLGCHNTYVILAWLEDEEVKFKKKFLGTVCND